MKYWSGKSVKIFILDGTSQSIPTESLSGIQGNVQYLHLPIGFNERMAKAIKLVKTEYTAFMGDDEFYLPSGLKACIQELERDENLVSCNGRCIAFRVQKNDIHSWFMYTDQKDYSVNSSNPIERMCFHMDKYTPSTVYAVTKTKEWKMAWQAFAQREYSVFAMAEIQYELSLSYLGKSKVIPVLVWLRSYENETVLTGQGSFNRNNKFEDWWMNGSNHSEKQEFLTILSGILSKAKKNKREEIQESIQLSLDIFYQNILMRKSQKKSEKKARLVKIFPDFFKKFLKSLLSGLGIVNSGSQKIEKLLPVLQKQEIRFNAEELEDICNKIIKFHSLKNYKNIIK